MESPKQILLTSIFETAVDGGSSNAYRYILRALELLPVEAKKITVTLEDVYKAMKPLSKKWEKEIDKVVQAD